MHKKEGERRIPLVWLGRQRGASPGGVGEGGRNLAPFFGSSDLRIVFPDRRRPGGSQRGPLEPRRRGLRSEADGPPKRKGHDPCMEVRNAGRESDEGIEKVPRILVVYRAALTHTSHGLAIEGAVRQDGQAPWRDLAPHLLGLASLRRVKTTGASPCVGVAPRDRGHRSRGCDGCGRSWCWPGWWSGCSPRACGTCWRTRSSPCPVLRSTRGVCPARTSKTARTARPRARTATTSSRHRRCLGHCPPWSCIDPFTRRQRLASKRPGPHPQLPAAASTDLRAPDRSRCIAASRPPPSSPRPRGVTSTSHAAPRALVSARAFDVVPARTFDFVSALAVKGASPATT